MENVSVYDDDFILKNGHLEICTTGKMLKLCMEAVADKYDYSYE
jgi:hypothetical protein